MYVGPPDTDRDQRRVLEFGTELA
ncbi:MAG: hypothetical protein JWM11_6316, partial [Planctomycetaceae bacterium]|nr:hypothetical protein [Planctomycetaceae bacterium]